MTMKKLITPLFVLFALTIGSSAGAPAQAAEGDLLNPARWGAAPPCFREDGSGQSACVWDASVRGNGLGASILNVRHAGEHHAIQISDRKAIRLIRQWRRENCTRVGVDYHCTGWNRIR